MSFVNENVYCYSVYNYSLSIMKAVRLDSYVLETLMPDLVGHDKKPSAFLVYIYLWSRLPLSRSRTVQASHQTIANETGLSKSAVQASLRHLLRRRLIRSKQASKTAVPIYSLQRPWRRLARSANS
jgi:DNA-binding MarR family transcriptional regulator